MAFDFEKGPKKGTLKPSVLAPTAPDPLADTEYTGDIEADCKAELDSLQTAYRDRAKQEQKRFTAATDSEFWVALCFKDRDSKEQFLEQLKLLQLGDKYLDGHEVARVLGVRL